MDLETWSQCLKVLADPTRVRLLAILEHEELTVAELASITGLAQPRVSTHLSKLKEFDLVRDRRSGVSAYYRFNHKDLEPAEHSLWQALRAGTDDPLLRQDFERLSLVLAQRANDDNWPDTVAGDMERHYSPGRTWEALARTALPLIDPGEVLDIASGDGVLAELFAPYAKRYVCIDSSQKVVLAARERLKKWSSVDVVNADMHELPFETPQFDLVLMMHALSYTKKPARVIEEAARVLKPKGELLLSCLLKHGHQSAVEPYGHENMGFTQKELTRFAEKAGLKIKHCEIVSRERRAPHFEIIMLLAEKASC
ncbi:MAG: ArsR family transcriptional regulator [Arenimonas sp.]|nr:ArsR family transcriptional regulator [Arenimonas sp.]